MKYFVFLEEKDSTDIASLEIFDTVEELNKYLSEAYFPDTWDYRVVEGVEKQFTCKVTMELAESSLKTYNETFNR